MSDLSSPPLSLVPVEDTAPAPKAAKASPGRRRPMPATRRRLPLVEPEPCQIEGMNGRLMNGTLLEMDPAEGVAKVRIPPARIAIPLRFNQFRKLTLTRPLAALEDAGADSSFMAQRPAVDVKVNLKGAAPIDTLSIGHHRGRRTACSCSRRWTRAAACCAASCRKAAYDSVEIGERIGEVLVAQHAATPAQIEQALAEQQQAAHAQARRHPADQADRHAPRTWSRPSSSRRACRWCASARR